jgi:drug/metabolite transporter (DMT)-like permease
MLIAVMTIWGFNVVGIKLLSTVFMPVTISALRIFTAGVCVFITLGFMKKVRTPTKLELKFIMIGALFNVVGHHYFLSVGLKITSASNGGLILGLGPLLTTVLAMIFLGNSLTIARFMGIVLGLMGVTMVVLRDGSINGISIGDLFIFISIFSQAISFIFISKISKTLDPRLMTGYMLIIGSVILFIISLLTEPTGLQSLKSGTLDMWVLFFASASIATAFGHMAYNFAVGKIGAAETSIFINLNPPFALVGAALFLGEKIVLTQLIGFLFILTGVLLGSDIWKEVLHHSKHKNKVHLSS